MGGRWTSCSGTCSVAGWLAAALVSAPIDIYCASDPPRAVVRADLAGIVPDPGSNSR